MVEKMTEQSMTHTSDESILAAISHFFGLLVALIVWATQKDKSRYVRFQAIQAMAFDLVVSVIMFLAVGGMLILIFGALALGIGDIAILGTQGNPTAEPFRTVVAMLAVLPLLIPCLMIPLVLLIFVARLLATVQTFQGKDFRYPWLGSLVDRSIRN